MKLLVDIGNSRVKWALMRTALTKSYAFAYSKESISSIIDDNWHTFNNIRAMYVSNVAGKTQAQQLSQWAHKKWRIAPVFISSEAHNFGITNGYLQPESLGSDRWLALIAARQRNKQAVCVIDCGSAITLDVMDKDGIHQGGMIVPGLALMRSSLAKKTSNIDNIKDDSPLIILSCDTQSAVTSGTLYLAVSCLERAIADLKDKFNNDIAIILTGGDANKLIPLLSAPVAHYPNLVLEGLARYANDG